MMNRNVSYAVNFGLLHLKRSHTNFTDLAFNDIYIIFNLPSKAKFYPKLN